MKIGILGNGQLGQMLSDSVQDISDIEVSLYDLRAHSDEALDAFLASVERVSFETENIPAHIVARLESVADKLYPSLKALKTFQNRLLEKTALRAAGIDTADPDWFGAALLMEIMFQEGGWLRWDAVLFFFETSRYGSAAI